MTLKFKSEADFARWRKSLPDQPRLRVAASMGERVRVNDAEAIVRADPAKAPRRRLLPTRATVARVYACGCWALLVTGMLGAAWCLGALWGYEHAQRVLM